MARLQIATLGFRLTATRFAACDLMASLIAGENVSSILTVPTKIFPKKVQVYPLTMPI